ncbi:GntP family permease [Roseateles depolymerans]|uniref:Gluconate transporter n=1 Tax=Roseateles depolymerans TaxID=76731 RepID=A0A0U3CE14_9BURK|nr:SLC13 family permease [Roseateles depolymerans]ALV06968.1 Gluconate transporter [Roseateles depolymerans]REG19949.1 GntP family gluconate:H+ symporter [Roseateles depolymerans]
MSLADIELLLIALFSVLGLVGLIVLKPRLHPLVALLVVSMAVGLATGMPLNKLASAISSGAGKTLGAVGLVVALGAMLGKLLADSGVTSRIADAIVSRSSYRALPWAMAGVAFIIGIPMFFEVGLVVLLPLIFGVARKLETSRQGNGSAYVYVSVPVIAALAAMHGMVPPHPGPLTAIATLKTSVGATMIYGFVAAIPAIILGGPLYAAFIAPRMKARPDEAMIHQYVPHDGEDGHGDGSAQASNSSGSATREAHGKTGAVEATHAPSTGGPGVGIGVLCALLPALLMLFHAVAEVLLDKTSGLLHVSAFVGNPIVAMLLGLLLAMVLLRSGDPESVRRSLSASVKPISNVLLIIAGGGAFQQVLTDAQVGDAIVHMSHQFAVSPLLLGWLISMLLSVSTGSATVGIVGAAGLLAPLAASGGGINQPLLALSIGCGSLFFNYANHAGFWLVKESFGMSMGEATKTISVVQSIVSLVGLGMVFLLNLMPPLG